MLELRFGQAAARSRTVAELPRIQLHDPPGLRFPANCRAAPAAGCRWAERISGATSSTASNSRGGWTATEVFGVTTPLITTADGGKMGKTVAGAVWLHEDQLPQFDYWQFWRNTDDRDVGRFLRLFTDLPLDEIARLEALRGRGDQRRQDRARQRGDRDVPRREAARRRPPRPRARPSRRAARRRAADAIAVGRRDRHRRRAGRARLRRVEGRGAAADRRGRGARVDGEKVATRGCRSCSVPSRCAVSAGQEASRPADPLTIACYRRLNAVVNHRPFASRQSFAG